MEFKQSWQEKCMDTVCAFANTNGGTVYIGKNDSGKLVGLTNSKNLMDEIPNKINSILGFSPDVRLKREKNKECIQINVKPQPNGISLRGKFFIRSGSTTLELKGPQLQKFLLDKSGQTWESTIEENANLKDIDTKSIALFKELAKNRFPAASKEKSLKGLLEKLHLLNKGKITKAAILLFSKNPQKFIKSAHFKIGLFTSETELKNTDIIEGNLFNQVEQVLNLLKTKYLLYNSKINGLYRVESLEYPEAALREAIINSIIHKDYLGSHIQLRLDKDKLAIWNYGELPSELSVERLRKKHQSLPRNPKIADIFYKAGLIEAWGRGTTKIIEELVRVGLPEPIYENIDGGFSLTLLKDIYTEEFLLKKGLTERQIAGVLYIKKAGKGTNQIYRKISGTSERTATRDLALLVEKGILDQIGITGKGTEYTLRGHKGAIDAKGLDAIKTPKTPKNENTRFDDLDKKLKSLDEEIEKLDPDKDIKRNFDKNLFFEILDTWLGDLVKEFIVVIQKFNKYFTKPRHNIGVVNGIAWTGFVNENPIRVLKQLKEECTKANDRIQSNHSYLEIHTAYGSLIRGGLDTFGCNYGIQVKFHDNWFEIYMDDEVLKRNQNLQIKRLYHQPVSKNEAKELAAKFGELLYEHIAIGIDRIKEKDTNRIN